MRNYRLMGQIAGHLRAASGGMAEMGKLARKTRWERFLAQVDPEGKLPEVERIERAHHAERAYMLRLRLQKEKAASRSN